MSEIRESRSTNAFRNVLTGIGGKSLVLVFAFMSRTFFVRGLGADYNGINGLFTNILSVLCLADLGIANVLNYSLYTALKNGDRRKIAGLIHSFKRIYNIIAFSILGIGLAVLFFFPYIIDSPIQMKKIVICYILYLANTVATYLFIYRTTIINADEKQYVTNIYSTVTRIIMYTVQVIYLLAFREIFGYLIIQLLCTIIQNITLNHYVNKHYTYLKIPELYNGFDVSEIKLGKNVKATFIYKMSSVIINNSDNIIISILLGTTCVGYYSNYYMLIQYVDGFIYTAGTGVVASLGNLNAEKNSRKSYEIFKMLNLIYGILTCFCVCCFLNCVQNFIPIWVGSEYLLNNSVLYALVILFYINNVESPIWMYRETMGLFYEVRFVMAIVAILNIVFSVIGGIHWGLLGIIGATSVSRLLTQFWYEPYILYKKKFEESLSHYFGFQLKNLILTLIVVILASFLCNLLPLSGMVALIIRIVICAIITLGVHLLAWYKTDEMKSLIDRVHVMVSSRY